MNIGAALAMAFGVIIIIGAVLALPLWLLWNYLMPVLFGMPEITVWQSFCLMLLSNILFKSTIYSKN